MRRLATFVCLFASLNLVLSPVAMPHAHVHTDHADVYVHGGHDHALASAWVDTHDHHHADDSHADDHHSTTSHIHAHPALSQAPHQTSEQTLPQHHDMDTMNVAHAHIVDLDKPAIDWPTQPTIKCIANVAFELIHPPPVGMHLASFSHRVDIERRAVLHPPPRGPPVLV